MRFMNLKKQKKGITLIALVITIIVLLILTAVSIATLTGDNGILTKAQTAKTETEKASEEEQIKLAAMNATMNTKKYDYETGETDEDGNPIKVPIPAGFAPTEIEGENTVENGFVIVDSKGNEFVWIPVKNEEEYKRNTNYDNTSVSAAAEDDKNYLPDDLKEKAETEEKNEGDIEKETVVNAGGFYISRYEAGAEGGKLEGDKWTENPTLVSKKGATVWNYIKQEDCKKEAKTFINNSDVKSGLITGIQWDMVMKFIENNNNKQDGKGNPFDVTVVDNNRHKDELTTSGQNEADRVCNIYDLEGNCYEYVAERSDYPTDYLFVYRGCYYISVVKRPASYRGVTYGDANSDWSFRLVLYVM